MPVKIDKSSNSLPLSPAGEGKMRAAIAKPGDNSPSSTDARINSTSVNLGTTSSQLRSMGSGVANTPSVNAAKVAEIKQAISEGRFKVNASIVADSLIKSVTDLISSQKA
jgi:negative regulator of flagellin synthesis FlgM